ncbi:MAG: hypothetical protein ACP5NO_07020 [Thermoplasmata archaeon]
MVVVTFNRIVMNGIRVTGIFLILAGLLSVLLSIRSVWGWMQVYYFWSLTAVKPNTNPGGLPGISYSIPAVVHTYEVLLPWMITGIVLLVAGAILEISPHRSKILRSLS